MADEAHAEEVEDLALEPGRRLPDSFDRRQRRLFAISFHLEHEPVAVRERIEVKHHLDHLATRPVDGRDVLAVVELDAARRLQESADVDERIRFDDDESIALGLGQSGDRIGEASLEGRAQLFLGHFCSALA